MLDEALGIARRAEDQRVLAVALLNSTLTYTLDQHEGRDRLRQAAQLAEASGDPEVVLAANTGLMIGALLWADRAEFDRGLAEYERVAVEMGAVTPLLLNDINRAGAAALEGRYADAQAAFENARSRAASLGDPSHVTRSRPGCFPSPVSSGTRGTCLWRDRPFRPGRFPSRRRSLVWALSEAGAGEREEATERLHALLAKPEALQSGYLRRLTLAVLAEANAVLGDTPAAAQLYRLLQSEARQGACVNVGAHSYHGAVERYLGMMALTLGHADDAVQHHERALDVHERMRARGWAARSRYDLTRALLARSGAGDVERGSESDRRSRRFRSGTGHAEAPRGARHHATGSRTVAKIALTVSHSERPPSSSSSDRPRRRLRAIRHEGSSPANRIGADDRRRSSHRRGLRTFDSSLDISFTTLGDGRSLALSLSRP